METLKYNLSLPALFPSSDRSTTGYLLSQNEVSSFGSGLHPIELFTKGVPWGAQKTETVAKSIIDYSTQTEGQILLLKTTPTQII